MSYPVSSDENGIKIIPEQMVQEKMYYCLHNQKILLVFKDEHDFLNCYEIEDAEIIENVKNCANADDVEKSIESYIIKHNLKH